MSGVLTVPVKSDDMSDVLTVPVTLDDTSGVLTVPVKWDDVSGVLTVPVKWNNVSWLNQALCLVSSLLRASTTRNVYSGTDLYRLWFLLPHSDRLTLAISFPHVTLTQGLRVIPLTLYRSPPERVFWGTHWEV